MRAAGFSALQRAEIAEMQARASPRRGCFCVSVLFNEPKLLKSITRTSSSSNRRSFSALQRAEIAEIEIEGEVVGACWGFSALQRAEIAEILPEPTLVVHTGKFQCSSTSRNC